MSKYEVGQHLYRYDDCYYGDYMEKSELHLSIFVVVKITPAGAWVVTPNMVEAYKENPKEMYGWAKPKFVLEGTDGKRLCYPTLELALNSYLKRKDRQILLTTHTLRKAEAMKKVAQRMATQKLEIPQNTLWLNGLMPQDNSDVGF